MASASLVVFVVRTRRPSHASRPGRGLLLATAGVPAMLLVLPLVPHVAVLGFRPLPLRCYLVLALVILAYIAAAAVVKRWFYRRSAVRAGRAGTPFHSLKITGWGNLPNFAAS